MRALKEELVRLEARQEQLRAILNEPTESPPLIHPILAEVYRKKVADLHLALDHDESRTEAFELIRSLVDEIVLTPENDDLRVDLKGDLAAILTIAQNGRKPATISRDGLEQIKMVAGVGFEPTTFRL